MSDSKKYDPNDLMNEIFRQGIDSLNKDTKTASDAVDEHCRQSDEISRKAEENLRRPK